MNNNIRTAENTQRELLLEVRAMLPEILLTKPTPISTVEQKIRDLSYKQLLDLFASIPAIKNKLDLVVDTKSEATKNQVETRNKLYTLLEMIDNHHSHITDKITATMDGFSIFLDECEADFANQGISKELFREGVRRFNQEIDLILLLKDSHESAEIAISNSLYEKDKEIIKQDLLELCLNIQNGLL